MYYRTQMLNSYMTAARKAGPYTHNGGCLCFALPLLLAPQSTSSLGWFADRFNVAVSSATWRRLLMPTNRCIRPCPLNPRFTSRPTIHGSARRVPNGHRPRIARGKVDS